MCDSIFSLCNFNASLLDFAETLHGRYILEVEGTPENEREEERIRALQITIAAVIMTAITYGLDDDLERVNNFYKQKIEEVKRDGSCYGCNLK